MIIYIAMFALGFVVLLAGGLAKQLTYEWFQKELKKSHDKETGE